MQRLSAWFYLKNNKKRAAILVLSFGLFFALLYGVQFFMHPSTYMAEKIAVQGAQKMQMAYIDSYGKVNDTLQLGMDMSLWEPETEGTYEQLVAEINKGSAVLAEKLRADGTADHVFLCNTYAINVNSFGGGTTYYAPMLTKEELSVLTEYLGIKLLSGRFPETPGELIMDENMAKNRGFSVGDTLFDKETTLVGIVEYETYFAAGIDYEDSQMMNPDRMLYFLDDGTIPDLKAYFERFGLDAGIEYSASIQIYADEVNAIQAVEELAEEIQMPLGVMTYSIAIVMGLTVFFVYRLHVMDRYTEWCLYRSLGYSERQVYSLAFREFGICMGLSIGLAAVISVALCFTGGLFMRSKGMFYEYLLPEVLFQIVAIGILLSGIMQIPVVVAMKKVKTIDAMEEE